MTGAARQPSLAHQAERLIGRSFLAALAVGTIGGGLIGIIDFTFLAFQEPSSHPVGEVLNGFGLGMVFAPVFWIPSWFVLVTIALLWLGIAGGIDPRQARYVLAVLAFTLITAWSVATDEASNWSAPVPFLIALFAAIGIWVTVPWILKSPR